MSDSAAIQVLLATYNGAPFLTAQLDSILQQQGAPCHILARDDGSTDETPALLAAYARRHPDRLTVLSDGQRTGSPKRNVARLLAASSAPYVMLADQDDVWQPDKLRRSATAMQALEARHGTDCPALVFSDLVVVDRDLALEAPSYWARMGLDPRNITRLPRLLRQNVVTGCTTMLNRALVRLTLPIPDGAFMHDWWIALLACTLGEATFLREPTVLYRQHGQNVVGIAPKVPRRLWPRLRYHDMRRAEWEHCSKLAEALLQAHDTRLSPRDRAVLRGCVRADRRTSRLLRVATLVRHGFWHPDLRKNLATLWYLWNADAARARR